MLEQAIQRMKDRGVLVTDADPRRLALVVVSAHQGGAILTFTYQAEWPHADATPIRGQLRAHVRRRPRRTCRAPPRRPRRTVKRPATPEATTCARRLRIAFTRKGRATRERIVDVAAELMFRRGVADTSIDEVRNAAAVSGSQISHYFHDKRDLTRKVIAARRDDVQQFHTQPRLGTFDSLEALQAWADATSPSRLRLPQGGCVYGSLAGELTDADAEVHDDLAAGYDAWIALFRAGLTEMRDRGDLRPDADPRHLAVSLVAAHQGGAMVTFITRMIQNRCGQR